MIDSYKTIEACSEGLYKEKGSKFFAYAFPVANMEEIKEAQERIQKEHPKARHHCYAYRLGMDQNDFRANDDGEPSGSAGKPILGQIDSYELTNVIVIVVRYFGGTKLGVPGLIHAYKTSTKEALELAKSIKKTIKDVYSIHFDYSAMSDVMNGVKRSGVEIVNQVFESQAYIEIALPKSQAEKDLLQLRAYIAKISTDHAAVVEEIDGVTITFDRTI